MLTSYSKHFYLLICYWCICLIYLLIICPFVEFFPYYWILRYKSFRYMICKDFFCGLIFHYLDSILWRKNILNFGEVSFIKIFFHLSCILIIVFLKKSLPNPRSYSLFFLFHWRYLCFHISVIHLSHFCDITFVMILIFLWYGIKFYYHF